MILLASLTTLTVRTVHSGLTPLDLPITAPRIRLTPFYASVHENRTVLVEGWNFNVNATTCWFTASNVNLIADPHCAIGSGILSDTYFVEGMYATVGEYDVIVNTNAGDSATYPFVIVPSTTIILVKTTHTTTTASTAYLTTVTSPVATTYTGTTALVSTQISYTYVITNGGTRVVTSWVHTTATQTTYSTTTLPATTTLTGHTTQTAWSTLTGTTTSVAHLTLTHNLTQPTITVTRASEFERFMNNPNTVYYGMGGIVALAVIGYFARNQLGNLTGRRRKETSGPPPTTGGSSPHMPPSLGGRPMMDGPNYGMLSTGPMLPNPQTPPPGDGNGRFCQACGKLVPENLDNCPNCLTDFKPPASMPESEENIKKLESIGDEISEDEILGS